jgi:hypothetical protein
MNIEDARKLKVGDRVRCPADRGNPAFIGVVTYYSGIGATHANVSEPFLWVNVSTIYGLNAGVWPSNRLGRM